MEWQPLTLEALHPFVCRNLDYFTDYDAQVSTEQLVEDFWEDLPPEVEVTQRHLLAVYQGTHMVALVDYLEGYPHSHQLMIGYVVVDRAYRQQGMARSIVNEIERTARTNAFQDILLTVLQSDIRANQFWQACGFELMTQQTRTDYGMQLWYTKHLDTKQ